MNNKNMNNKNMNMNNKNMNNQNNKTKSRYCFNIFNWDIPIRIYSIYSNIPYNSYENTGYYYFYM